MFENGSVLLFLDIECFLGVLQNTDLQAQLLWGMGPRGGLQLQSSQGARFLPQQIPIPLAPFPFLFVTKALPFAPRSLVSFGLFYFLFLFSDTCVFSVLQGAIVMSASPGPQLFSSSVVLCFSDSKIQ